MIKFEFPRVIHHLLSVTFGFHSGVSFSLGAGELGQVSQECWCSASARRRRPLPARSALRRQMDAWSVGRPAEELPYMMSARI